MACVLTNKGTRFGVTANDDSLTRRLCTHRLSRSHVRRYIRDIAGSEDLLQTIGFAREDSHLVWRRQEFVLLYIAEAGLERIRALVAPPPSA